MSAGFVRTELQDYTGDIVCIFGTGRELARSWNECNKTDEKLRFVARYLDGEKIAGLCREFGISWVTGHKIMDRYKDCGMQAFTDRSRRPFRLANQLSFQVESVILQVKKEFPHWGAPKIRERLMTHFPGINALQRYRA